MSIDGVLIRDAVVYLISLVLSICVHEFGHAWVADRLGDPLPRSEGRVTLNPLNHIDPVGTLLLPLVAFLATASGSVLGGRILGWGKPVRVSLSARSMSRRFTLRTSHMLVALAGPTMNILFALVLSIVYLVVLRSRPDVWTYVQPVSAMIMMNFGLAAFNLLPCPPLDGGAIWRRFFPDSFAGVFAFLEKNGSFILLALILSGALRYVMRPVYWVSVEWLRWLAHVALGS